MLFIVFCFEFTRLISDRVAVEMAWLWFRLAGFGWSARVGLGLIVFLFARFWFGFDHFLVCSVWWFLLAGLGLDCVVLCLFLVVVCCGFVFVAVFGSA